MKRAVYVALAVVFALGAMASLSLAGPNVGNDNQQGSLLVFSKVVVKGTVDKNNKWVTVTEDTLLHLVNNFRGAVGDNGDVLVECYWMNEAQANGSFSIALTHTDPYDMWASDRLPGRKVDPAATVFPTPAIGLGEFKCFAVAPDFSSQIKFNFLFGNAMIFDFVNGTAEQYSSYNFRAIPGVNRAKVGTAGTIKLDGIEYDGCPARVMGSFIPPLAAVADFAYVVDAVTTDLTLVPCTQSLGQDTVPVYGKAEMLFWDYDETRLDTVYVCYKCWMETTLDAVPVTSLGVTKVEGFKIFNEIDGDIAYFEARGVNSNACPNPVTAIPIIGVLRSAAMVNGQLATFATGLNQTSTLWTGAAPTITWGNETDPDPNPELSGR